MALADYLARLHIAFYLSVSDVASQDSCVTATAPCLNKCSVISTWSGQISKHPGLSSPAHNAIRLGFCEVQSPQCYLKF